MSSAARAHGSRTCAVVLTGRRQDGAGGVRAVKRVGGYVMVQDPTRARAAEMPRAAVATGCADLVLPLPVVGPALVAIAMSPGAIDMFPRSPRPWADISAP
jgi:two-component system chemotaxis response regulator CheB